MKLYLMRHGHSPTVGEAGVARDFDRPLSDEGAAAVRLTAAELNRRGGKPALILHSPLTRAVQTAETAQAALSPKPAIEAFDPLSNVLAPEAVFEKLRPRLAECAELLAVGHQPQIGELAMMLSGKVFDFRPGGLFALELPDAGGEARILWSFSPQDLPAR